MVSEDSQDLGWFPVIHRLRDLCDLDQAKPGQVSTSILELDDSRELLEIVLLRSSQWIFPEERNDYVPQMYMSNDAVSKEVLSMIVLTVVHSDAAATEEAAHLFKDVAAAR
jgi:hypothetical protein